MENNSSFLRKIVVVLLILLFFVLQCSVFNSLAMGGIIPQSDDHSDFFLRIYERGEGGTADRIFLRAFM